MIRLNQALRAIFSSSDPNSGELEQIEQSYRRRIADPRRHRRRAVWPAVAAAIAVFAAIVALQPSPVVATLTEIAQAARTVQPSDLPADVYFFTESTSTFEQTITLDSGRELSYLIDEDRRVWVSRDGTQVVVQITRTNPVFRTENDRSLYFDSGLEASDNLNIPQTTAVDGVSHDATERSWPLEAEPLLEAIRDLPNVNTDTEATAQLLNLLTESPAPRELRAAAIAAIAQLDLQFVDRSDDLVVVRTEPRPLDNQIIEFALDSQGQLRHRVDKTYDSNDPSAERVIVEVGYSPTIVVDGPPSF